jgi:hypothetical protein
VLITGIRVKAIRTKKKSSVTILKEKASDYVKASPLSLTNN